MTKRRTIQGAVILLVLTAFAIWLEPTRVVWGWLRGEAFYQGRPTSFWHCELDWHEQSYPPIKFYPPYISHYRFQYAAPELTRRRSFVERLVLPKERPDDVDDFPLLNGEPASLPVLEELLVRNITSEQRQFVTGARNEAMRRKEGRPPGSYQTTIHGGVIGGKYAPKKADREP